MAAKRQNLYEPLSALVAASEPVRQVAYALYTCGTTRQEYDADWWVARIRAAVHAEQEETR